MKQWKNYWSRALSRTCNLQKGKEFQLLLYTYFWSIKVIKSCFLYFWNVIKTVLFLIEYISVYDPSASTYHQWVPCMYKQLRVAMSIMHEWKQNSKWFPGKSPLKNASNSGFYVKPNLSATLQICHIVKHIELSVQLIPKTKLIVQELGTLWLRMSESQPRCKLWEMDVLVNSSCAIAMLLWHFGSS